MNGKLTQRQLIIVTIIILMVMGCIAAVKTVHSFQARNDDRRQIINDISPDSSGAVRMQP